MELLHRVDQANERSRKIFRSIEFCRCNTFGLNAYAFINPVNDGQVFLFVFALRCFIQRWERCKSLSPGLQLSCYLHDVRHGSLCTFRILDACQSVVQYTQQDYACAYASLAGGGGCGLWRWGRCRGCLYLGNLSRGEFLMSRNKLRLLLGCCSGGKEDSRQCEGETYLLSIMHNV